MIYYAKLSHFKIKENIIAAFQKVNVPEDKIIFDSSSLQKQNGCLYFELKDTLLKQKKNLMIDSLSSLGKNSREIQKELIWFYCHQISLFILDIPSTLETDTPLIINKTILEVYSQLAEKEIANTKLGQKQGIENARSQGKPLGRTKIDYPKNWEPLYKQWKQKKITAKDFMEQANLKKGTFYNLVKQYEATTSSVASKLA